MALDAPLKPPVVCTEDRPLIVQALKIAGRDAWVCDHAVPVELRQPAYDDLSGRSFTFTNQDSDATEFVSHLIHQGDLVDSGDAVIDPLVGIARAVCRSVGHEALPIERVYVTTALFGDFQHVHQDGHVWTVLFFANARWHTDWGGELLLYQDEDATIATAVAPRPGRVVIFDGMLKHRAGVPSKYCPEPRIILAVKFLR
ncbi:MAG: hypothetical protein ACI9WU_000913 [Myxococcota bacterium]|jgi:hypothetical protein